MTQAEMIRRHPISKIPHGRGRSLQQMRLEIHALRVVQSPLGFLFWLLEQRNARIANEIERVQS
jgi:hypothetical protein